MAIPQYRPSSFGFANRTSQLIRIRSSSSSSSSDSIENCSFRVPPPNLQQSKRVRNNLSSPSSHTTIDDQRSRRLQGHCRKCHQMRTNRWNHEQRYSMPSSSHQHFSESEFRFFVPMTVANERKHASSIERRCRRRNRG